MSAPAAAEPRLQFTCRSRTGVQCFWGPRDVSKVEGVESASARTFEYSKDGSLLALVNPENVTIYNTHTSAIRSVIPRPHVTAIAFSPLGSFIVTFERLDQAINNHENNLIVWRIEDATAIMKFSQKNFLAENWPTVKWSDDEVYFGRTVTNEAQLFSPKMAKPTDAVRRIQLKDIINMEFAPGVHPYKLVTYVPERKSSPASVRIHSLPLPAAPVDIKVITTKSFFKSTSAEFLWNSTGTALLVSTSTDVDQSGKSYYGETGLYFLSADGSYDCNVVLPREGPIHDVSWSPSGKEFIVTYGFMPAQSTLFDSKSKPVLDFGVAPRNTIRWSPNGKLVCLGGFGNLQGQMDFWDVKSTKKIGTATAHCASVCEWAPDSRHFIAATVSPRIRVDNGYKIFRHDGNLVSETLINELYQVVWRPALAGVYAERALSPYRAPPVAAAAAAAVGSPAPSTAKYQHPNASKYVHPNAKEGGSSSSSSIRPEDTGIRRYGEGGASSSAPAAPLVIRKPMMDNNPPGWTDDPKDAKKKKPKKNKKAKAKEAEAAGGSVEEEADESPAGSPAITANNRGKQKEAVNSEEIGQGVKALRVNNNKDSRGSPAASPQPRAQQGQQGGAAAAASPKGGLDENQKRAKVIAKKIGQIDRLKLKRDGGEQLTAEEVVKVGTEDQLRKELASLTAK